MKILMVNKSLAPGGGAQTYVLKLGDYLISQGHKVQFFGMYSKDNCVGNAIGAYTEEIDFHNARVIDKARFAFKVIYSWEARKKIRLVLNDFQPDVVHLNNIYYHLTPSIILEIVKWREENNRECRIVFTAHDYSLVCPNHMLNNPISKENCEKCLGGHFLNCVKGRCIHGSRLRSLLGTVEACYWNKRGTYRYIDKIICCSEFMKQKLDTNPLFAAKTIALLNFTDKVEWKDVEKKDYVLYFGRFSEEKGINTLLEAVKLLPDIPFVFAGKGPMEEKIHELPNIKNVGFKTGEELDTLIREARFSLCPSEVHENCPFSVLESQERGTPVIAAKVGGVPELIEDGKNGRLFERKDSRKLAEIIEDLWNDSEKVEEYRNECRKIKRNGLPEYYRTMVDLYSVDANCYTVD